MTPIKFFLITLLTLALLGPPGFVAPSPLPEENPRIKQARLERIPCADLGNGLYRNPVLVGPGSDNSVIRVGPDFYMLAGGGWPDELIWHSRDLVNWEPVTRALRKWDGGTWASDIVHHDGRLYIYTTQVDPRRGDYQGPLNVSQRSLLGVPFKDRGDKAWKNIVLWADKPKGPWSDPINMEVYGLFDPGHVVDRIGNRWLYFNQGMMIRLNPDGLSVVGDLEAVYSGWDYPKDWVVECKCLEAPKLVFHKGFYYMASAQGGTAGPSTAHMAIIARAKSVQGPWENSPYNPLIRTKRREEKWWRQGHGTLIDDIEGKWWLMYTGYENGYSHYGKQSLLLPIEWTEDGWPIIPQKISVTDILPKPAGENVGHGMPLSDDFNGPELGIQWNHAPSLNADVAFQAGGGRLIMKAAGNSRSNATSLWVMPVNHMYEVEVEITIDGDMEAGLLLSGRGGDWASSGLRKGEAFAEWNGQDNYLKWDRNIIFVRMRNNQSDVSCRYSSDGKLWTPFENSTETTGVRRVILYAFGHGEAVFKAFKYRGLD